MEKLSVNGHPSRDIHEAGVKLTSDALNRSIRQPQRGYRLRIWHVGCVSLVTVFHLRGSALDHARALNFGRGDEGETGAEKIIAAVLTRRLGNVSFVVHIPPGTVGYHTKGNNEYGLRRSNAGKGDLQLRYLE